jgi:ABC-type bacteriocin/lantibiotic exporter with double-glycine peptidase domain
LRVASRWSLQRGGARFVAAGDVRLQQSLNDCGPTALADLLAITGHRVPSTDSMRKLTRLTSRGTTLADLEQAGRMSGLAVTSIRWNRASLATLPLPALVWVDRHHFVVVAHGPSLDTVEIRDPAAGRYRIARDRFAQRWSGDALVITDSLASHRTSHRGLDARPLRAQGMRTPTVHSMESGR